MEIETLCCCLQALKTCVGKHVPHAYQHRIVGPRQHLITKAWDTWYTIHRLNEPYLLPYRRRGNQLLGQVCLGLAAEHSHLKQPAWPFKAMKG